MAITLLPVLGKIYEKVLYKRYRPWAKQKRIICDLQGTDQDHCSSMHTAWLLRETIACSRENGKSVYVGLLDISKAFDSVWIDGMLYQLYNTGLDGKLWRIIRSFYQDFTCSVQIGTFQSEFFKAMQGVHQGAYWSMKLFEHMFNPLLLELKAHTGGCSINSIKSGNPTFADDISVAAGSRQSLQELFNNAYSKKWRFKFNSSKSKVMIFGKDTNPEMDVRLGDSVIEVVSSSPHMGVVLTDSRKDQSSAVGAKIQSAKKDLGAILSIGSISVPASIEIRSHLYWSVCMSRLSYGSEIAGYNEQSIIQFEKFHGHAAKVIQGMPNQTVNAACLAPLGWMSFQGYVDLKMMLFLWRILLLPVSCIYRQVVIARLWYHIYCRDGVHLGPSNDIVERFKKYAMLDMLVEALCHAKITSIGIMKGLVRKTIVEYENKCYQATVLLYKRMDIFGKCIPSIDMWPWYVFVNRVRPFSQRECKSIARLVFRESCLNGDQDKMTKQSSTCSLCDSGWPEDATHLLFVCEKFSDLRKELWSNVESSAPPELVTEMCKMTTKDRSMFILSAFNVKYVPEWDELYNAVLEFIHKIYVARGKYIHL